MKIDLLVVEQEQKRQRQKLRGSYSKSGESWIEQRQAQGDSPCCYFNSWGKTRQDRQDTLGRQMPTDVPDFQSTTVFGEYVKIFFCYSRFGRKLAPYLLIPHLLQIFMTIDKAWHSCFHLPESHSSNKWRSGNAMQHLFSIKVYFQICRYMSSTVDCIQWPSFTQVLISC